MTEMNAKGELCRLEDFIGFAREGKRVELEVGLRKQLMHQKVHPDETHDMKDNIATYLLIAEYTFTTDGQSRKMSKVYMYAALEESIRAAQANKNIANARLQADYGRLRAANIAFQEKFF
jgi:hypothetical protein